MEVVVELQVVHRVEQVKEQLREHLENHPALNILRQDDLHM